MARISRKPPTDDEQWILIKLLPGNLVSMEVHGLSSLGAANILLSCIHDLANGEDDDVTDDLESILNNAGGKRAE